MKIMYVANVRIPSERAHGIQIMNTCSALAAAGADVVLVVPRRLSPSSEDPFRYYGLTENFKIERLASFTVPLPGPLRRFSYLLGAFTFSCSVLYAFRRCLRSDTAFYGREETVLAPISMFSKNVFWETHLGHVNSLVRMLMARARGVVCITKGLASFYSGKGVPQDRLLVAPDAVDLTKYDAVKDDKAALRAKLGLPVGEKIVHYNGSIGQYSWKGVDTFLGSLAYAKAPDIRYVVTGGTLEEVAALRKAYPDQRIILKGRVPNAEVPSYLKAADVVVLPNKPGNAVSERYTSPMKLFEYMAAGRPIVASDLPSIREVLGDDNAAFFAAGDAKSLADVLGKVLADEAIAGSIAAKAYSDVKRYTWDARAAAIFSFIRKSDAIS